MFVPTFLVVEGNIDATIANVLSNGSLYSLSIVCALLVQVTHIFIVLLLYKLLKSVNQNMAVLMVIFMLVSIPITMINELNNYAALFMAHNASTAISLGQMKEMVFLFLNLHEYGILISSVFWGLWLFPMGYLVYKSHFLPKILGIVLMIAFFFYVSDSLLSLGIPWYTGTAIAQIMKIPMYGELLFPLWLLFKGIKPSLDTAQ